MQINPIDSNERHFEPQISNSILQFEQWATKEKSKFNNINSHLKKMKQPSEHNYVPLYDLCEFWLLFFLFFFISFLLCADV